MRTDTVRPRRKKPAALARSSPRRMRRASTAADAPAVRAPRDPLELRVLQSFRTIVGATRAHDAQVRARTGISGSQLWALAEICREGGMSVNAVAERLALHQTTASNLANALSERRLIRRLRDQADQRVVRLYATADGMRLLVRAPRPYTGLLVDALRRLEAPGLSRLSRELASLLAAMRPAGAVAGGEMLTGE